MSKLKNMWLYKKGFQVQVQSFIQKQGNTWFSQQATQEVSKAFVFDIDGVLLLGRKAIPEAKKALGLIFDSQHQKPQYPVTFLTNGGGYLEAQRAQMLSEILDFNIKKEQVVLSHTPFQQYSSQYKDKPVLVSGKGDLIGIMNHYGFNKVITTSQLAEYVPSMVPHLEKSIQGQTQGHEDQKDFGTEEQPIEAVFILCDSMNWYIDLQCIIDTLMTKGIPQGSAQSRDAEDITLFISQQDFVFPNEYKLNRLALGSFVHALDQLYHKSTGRHISSKIIHGKPELNTYEYVNKIILKQKYEILGQPAPDVDKSPEEIMQLLKENYKQIFMIGDNPASDIKGANIIGSPYKTILVQTGLYKPDKSGQELSGYNFQENEVPDYVVKDVFEAVEGALRQKDLRN